MVASIALAGLLGLLAACASGSSVRPPIPTVTAVPSVTPTATLPPAVYAPVLLTKGFGCPDDLALDSQSRVIFSDQGNGTINRIDATGITTLARGLDEPEGIIVLPDGTLIVGEQGNAGEHLDRLDVVGPGTTTPQVLVTFTNATDTPGVDGLSIDPRTGDILVADSPNGTVVRVSRDGKNRTVLARGFVRPVQALADAQGNIFVADEYGNEVVRIAPNGTVTRLIHLADPDDLAFDRDGTLLVTVLGDNTVVRIDPVTGKNLGVVGSHLFEPQGLVVDAHGNLYVSEETANAVVELVRGRSTPGANLPGLSGSACR
jgi:serine/threonine-protein kinase